MDPVVSGGPWFRRHPQWAAVVTAGLFVVVTALRLLTTNEADVAGLLYALPVALAAMAYGRVVGATASLCAAGLLWAWVAGHPEISLTALGWGARTVPLLLLGVLVGAAADAVEDASTARMALAVAEARRRDAAEVHDQILQRLTVAKWRLEAGSGDDAAALLDEAMEQGQQLVSSLLHGIELDDRLQARPPDTADRGERRGLVLVADERGPLFGDGSGDGHGRGDLPDPGEDDVEVADVGGFGHRDHGQGRTRHR